MSKYDGRKVIKAALESNIFLPGIGDINKEVTSQNNALSRAIDMTLEGDFVVMKIKSKTTGAEAELLVPTRRFTYLSVEKEEVKPLKKPFLG